MDPIKCRHCGYEWNSRVPNPKACPNCKRYIKPPKIAAVVMLLMGSILFQGCAGMRTKMATLETGMDKQAVIAKLGRPDGSRLYAEQTEKIEYTNRVPTTFGPKQRADYYVLLKEGRVVAYGQESITQIQTNDSVQVIVPFDPNPQQPMPMSPGEFARGMGRSR